MRAVGLGTRWGWSVLLGLAAAGLPGPSTAAPPRLPLVRPEQAGMDAATLARIDAVVEEGLQARNMPGCVVAIGRHGKLVLWKAYGSRQLLPQPVPMTTDTLFDLASLTKPVATATSLMLLIQAGKLRLEDRVAAYLPEFGQNGKQQITVLQLLTHQSGLVADNPLADYQDGPARAWQRLCGLKPLAEPGSKFIYSDVGYIVLGELVERVSGQRLAEFAQENIFQPLGMTQTGFQPDAERRQRAAPTENRDGKWICGEVHDPRAHLLGGVAGHAGLFSTAGDLAVFAQMMLGRGQYGGVRILAPETVELMTRPLSVPGGLRGLGWDIRTPLSTNRSERFSSRAFGHGGFTGTVLWIDPEHDLFVIFLSNRLHPDGKGAVNRLAKRIGTLAVEAIAARQSSEVSETSEVPGKAQGLPSPGVQSPKPALLTGIDVLQRDGFCLLRGSRVGLITNQTGVNQEGISTARLLKEAPGVQLVALMSPEHGLRGDLDVAHVPDSRDPETGLRVYSLYGKTRRPTAEMLKGIDTLVFDIQDIGTRFYTYISTMGLAMQAAAKQKIRFVVLDRPNPVGGIAVAGPVLDPGRESFVGFHRLPVRHGMTAGELARMFKAELGLDLDLVVVPLEGWRRGDWFDATGLRWINPSPNMRSLTEAILYPAIGLLETTNLSVGRGTDTPFELLGAPWLDGPRLAEELNRCGLGGVRFEPAAFTPVSSKFQHQRCSGVRILLTDREAFDPVRTGLTIAAGLRRLYPGIWEAEKVGVLLGNSRAMEALLAGKDVAQIEATWQAGLEQFRQRRARFLLY
ncbi:MAG: exo-beta-N-acetylmuramidase NamZ domain-containing protein [Thermoguttaceae bacterium]